jgi:hypothetical protein
VSGPRDIAGRLLSVDVSEYLCFRSACKPWREYTEEPRSCHGGLDRHFRPRNWIAVSHCTSPSRRSLVNASRRAIKAFYFSSEPRTAV